jgi:hypothetical protein
MRLDDSPPCFPNERVDASRKAESLAKRNREDNGFDGCLCMALRIKSERNRQEERKEPASFLDDSPAFLIDVTAWLER